MKASRTALAVAVVAVTALSTACGSVGGGSNNDGGGGNASVDATAVAKALGINLADCGIDPTKKVTGDVTIGEAFPKSGGPASIFAPIGAAVQAAFDTYNATATTKINLKQVDDQFNPAMTQTAAKQLIDQDNVLALTTVLGTANILAIQKLLTDDCVPLVSGQAGGAEANSPKTAPWSVIFTLPSAVDARIWVDDITAKNPDGAKIALFTANDSSGKDYVAAIKHYVAGTKNTIVSEQTIEDTDSAAPASQVTTMRASGATVLLSAPTGGQCVSEMKEIASQGWKPAQYMSYTCPSSLFDLTGSAADGVFLNQYIKDPTRAPYNTDPAVLKAKAELLKESPSTPVGTTSFGGFVYVESLFKAVAQAQMSALGLSRLGLLQAATHLEYQPDLTIPGITFSLNYPSDVVALEGAQLTSYKAASKTFDYLKLYNYNGEMTGVASS